MSTKSTIRISESYSPGYHIYRDAFPVELPAGGEKERAVVLELRGVNLLSMCSDMSRGGVDLEVAMPESLATQLGLIKDGE